MAEIPNKELPKLRFSFPMKFSIIVVPFKVSQITRRKAYKRQIINPVGEAIMILTILYCLHLGAQNGGLLWVSGQRSDGEIRILSPGSPFVKLSDCESLLIGRLGWYIGVA